MEIDGGLRQVDALLNFQNKIQVYYIKPDQVCNMAEEQERLFLILGHLQQ
jgi:hypothetical protein